VTEIKLSDRAHVQIDGRFREAVMITSGTWDAETAHLTKAETRALFAALRQFDNEGLLNDA
jgi:hypothetical protein